MSPLAKGSSQEVIGRNIKELMKAGWKRRQAIAISFKKAGKSKSK